MDTLAFEPVRGNNLTVEMKAEMKRSNGELTELAGPIVAGDTNLKLAVTNDQTDDKLASGHAIQAVRKQYGGKTYVIAVNVTRQEVNPTLKLEQLTASEAIVWKENRTVKVEGGALADTFKPLEVHVYVLK